MFFRKRPDEESLGDYNEKTQQKKIVIIGAGLSGLSTAIRFLQSYPTAKVLILEKRSQAGGACGLVNINGHDFELSTQMGKSALNLLEELGITPEIERVSNELFYSDGTLIRTPFDARSMWLLFYPLSIIMLAYHMYFASDSTRLSSLQFGFYTKFKQILLGMFGYPAAQPDVTIGRVRRFWQDPAGHASPFIIKRGIMEIVECMVNEIKKLGGQIMFNVECESVSRSPDGGRQLIKIKDGSQYDADIVISSAGWNNYPANAKRGLPLISIFCVMNSAYKHPEGIHTTAFFPRDVDDLFQQLLNNGSDRIIQKPAFHCFFNKLPQEQKGVTIFVPMPYGTTYVDPSSKDDIYRYVINQMERRFKGFREKILESYCLSPQKFEQQFGLLSNAPTFIAPEGFIPPTYDTETGVYFIGDSTCPEHPSIFGALKSSRERTEEIMTHESEVLGMPVRSPKFQGREQQLDVGDIKPINAFSVNF